MTQQRQFSGRAGYDTLRNSLPRRTPEAAAAEARSSSALLLLLVTNRIDTRARFAPPPEEANLKRFTEEPFCATGDEDPRRGNITRRSKPSTFLDVPVRWRPHPPPLVRASSLSLSPLSPLTALDGRCRVSREQPAVMRAHGPPGPPGPPGARRVCLEMDLGWDPAGVWLPPPPPPCLAPLFLRAVITADCMSQRPALIGLSFSVHFGVGGGGWGGWEEPPYVGLPWRLGRLMSEHAVTNDIPEPIGYSANGQFAESLTNGTQIAEAHTSAWSELIECRTVRAVNQYTMSGRKACHLFPPRTHPGINSFI